MPSYIFDGMILFTDFDGVLVNFLKFHDYDQEGIRKFQASSIRAYNKLVNCLHAKVVISSTWRTELSPKQLQRIFRKRGIHAKIIGTTPDYGGIPMRGKEIADYIERYNIKNYLVVDDITAPIAKYIPKSHIIKTNPYRGLTMKDVDITLTKRKIQC